MSLFSSARKMVRESGDLAKLLTLDSEERAVVVYAEDSFSHVQLSGYLDCLWRDHGLPYQYVTSDENDPLLSAPPAGANVWYIERQLARMLNGLECGVFVTTMPDLGRFHVPRPKSGTTLYAFHSLNSAHSAYRAGAFTHYDSFMCTGPHHVAELSHMRENSPVLANVGYHKLDVVRREYESYTKPDEEPVVLLAPSWGRHNLLEAHGEEIVSSLLSRGLGVIVRPHPQFFHSLYPEGAGVIANLQKIFAKSGMVEFELSIDDQDSFYRADLMISDWSGAAFEYSLGTLRPALFVDTPQKIMNDQWQSIGLPSFEREMREKVGAVLATDRIGEVGGLSEDLISDPASRAQSLDALGSEVVFNFGRAAEEGARFIASH